MHPITNSMHAKKKTVNAGKGKKENENLFVSVMRCSKCLEASTKYNKPTIILRIVCASGARKRIGKTLIIILCYR